MAGAQAKGSLNGTLPPNFTHALFERPSHPDRYQIKEV